jgi:CDP-4-dehydro-6-deoxyglucose reductase
MSLAEWQSAEVVRIAAATQNTKRFFLRIAGVRSFDFKPGQFLTFDLPIHPKKTKRWRSYSIASAPDGSNEVELIISYAPEGLASNYLWNEVKEGSLLTFKGPLGGFTLPPELNTDLCLIATGTGIAPYRSMLLDLIRHPRPSKSIHLIFGTRYLQDVLYREELESWPQIIPGFSFHLTLSREQEAGYTGRKGYVHPVYEALFSDRREAQFYLCGWRNMIDEAQQRILAMGYRQKNIHIELYG